MFMLASWISTHIVCIKILTPTVVYFAITFIAMWVILDSILVATDLMAAESEIKNLQGQIRFQTNQIQMQNMVCNETLKKVKDNNVTLCELRTRITSLQHKRNRLF